MISILFIPTICGNKLHPRWVPPTAEAMVARLALELARSDLRSLPQAFPSDHDDDHGGATGSSAVGDRLWRRLRIAPFARNLDRRRANRKPDLDPQHDAGHLPLSRLLPLMGGTALAQSTPGPAFDRAAFPK